MLFTLIYFDSPLQLVETKILKEEKELIKNYETFLDQGYEGAIVRNSFGMYVNKRSVDLLKVKEFQDAEFKVIGIEEGAGKLAGHAIMICTLDNDKEFRVKMSGETSKLKEYFDHPETVINKWLTVQFQGFTKDAKPRFPVGLRFRVDI
jgi:DNA ligase-1